MNDLEIKVVLHRASKHIAFESGSVLPGRIALDEVEEMRMANTVPASTSPGVGHPVDLQDAVEVRLREKNPGWGGAE